mgnify:CR=1 FL=1
MLELFVDFRKALFVKKFFASLALLLGATLGLTGCSGANSVEITDDTVIIDVRTPEEFQGGHLEGAINIDVQSADFAEKMMELDPNGEYYGYCRSGTRSSQAVAWMNQMGFNGENITNGGGFQDASKATGIPLVQ